MGMRAANGERPRSSWAQERAASAASGAARMRSWTGAGRRGLTEWMSMGLVSVRQTCTFVLIDGVWCPAWTWTFLTDLKRSGEIARSSSEEWASPRGVRGVEPHRGVLGARILGMAHAYLGPKTAGKAIFDLKMGVGAKTVRKTAEKSAEAVSLPVQENSIFCEKK